MQEQQCPISNRTKAEKTMARLQLSPKSRHELLLYNLTHEAKHKVDDYWTDSRWN